MAITTGATLATAVANWMQRVDLSSRIPEFVALAESKMNRYLRTPEMETKDAAFSITGEYVAVPTGFLEARTFYLNTSPYESIAYLSPDSQTGYMESGTGRPVYFSVVGTNFRFAPVPDATYAATLVYWKAPTTCSTGSTETNWLLTAHPDVYLYGTLAEANEYAQDFAAADNWRNKFMKALAEVRDRGNRQRWGGSAMQTRPG